MTTIGQKLKEAREDQRLTIEQVFESTRIRMQYLQALEEDDLSAMRDGNDAAWLLPRAHLKFDPARDVVERRVQPTIHGRHPNMSVPRW